MSQISAIFGTDDDNEIMNSLYIIANVRFWASFLVDDDDPNPLRTPLDSD